MLLHGICLDGCLAAPRVGRTSALQRGAGCLAMRRLPLPAMAAAGRLARRHRRRRTGWVSARGAWPLLARRPAPQGRGESSPQQGLAADGCQALVGVRQPGRRPPGARTAN